MRLFVKEDFGTTDDAVRAIEMRAMCSALSLQLKEVGYAALFKNMNEQLATLKDSIKQVQVVTRDFVRY